MRRLLGIVVIVALALPFAAAFGASKAPCCCKGAMSCALKQKTSCAVSCSMTAAQADDAIATPQITAQQALTAFTLTAPAADTITLAGRTQVSIADHTLPPDPPPPRA